MGGCERALNTTSRPQGGTAGGRGECNLLSPLRKLTTNACPPIDCLPCGERNEALAAKYTFSVDGRDPLPSLYCRKLRTSDTVQVAGSIWAWPHHFTNTPHFKAYKRLVEGACASKSISSTRECSVLSLSDIPQATTHEGSTTPGSGATPSHPPGIANPSWWGSARAVPPAVLSGLGTKAGSGRWVSLKLTPSWSCIPVAISGSEETHTAWLLASTMSARPLPAGSETGRRTAGSAPSCSWRTDPPPLSRRGSKCNLHSPWGIPFLDSMSALRDRGCALLWWRGSDNPPRAGDPLPVCTEPWSERRLVIYLRDHRHDVGAYQYMLEF